MTSDRLQPVQDAWQQVAGFLRRQRWQMVAVASASAGAALLGLGLAHSLLPLLPDQAALLSALVAGLVTALVLPLAIWARRPVVPRLNLVRAAMPPQSGTAVPLSAVAPLPAEPAGLAAGGSQDAQRPVRDALTGAYTQQHFVAAADREWSRIRRHGEDAALLMIDIDRMKGINDRYGAECGDALLVEITRQVSTTLRQYDLLARFGGGVLVIYLPHTDPIGALDVAERIRERVAALRVTWQSHTVRSTVSVGVAGIGASHGALDEVIADAGGALREAKAAGRNCVRAAPIPPRRNVHPFATNAKRPAGPM
jgi:diguanylate cyclase